MRIFLGEMQQDRAPQAIAFVQVLIDLHAVVAHRGVVNCGRRTRSIIGAQSLINARVHNKVVSLKDGTMAWHLADLEVVRGATRRPPEVSAHGLQSAREAAARVAARCGIARIDRRTLESWRAEATQRSLYVLDVRSPEE